MVRLANVITKELLALLALHISIFFTVWWNCRDIVDTPTDDPRPRAMLDLLVQCDFLDSDLRRKFAFSEALHAQLGFSSRANVTEKTAAPPNPPSDGHDWNRDACDSYDRAKLIFPLTDMIRSIKKDISR